MNKYKTFWRRFWAGWVDFLVFAPLFPVNLWLTNHATDLPPTALALWHVASSIIGYAYNIVMHGKYGQTLGKMALKIKVLDSSESRRISFKQAFLRDCVPLLATVVLLPHDVLQIFAGTSYLLEKEAMPDAVSMILVYATAGWFCLEVVTMLTNAKRRAIHDFIAHSVVVKL